MRPLAPADLSVAARMLLTFPQDQRPTIIRYVIDKAEAADRYCKRLRRTHPVWGNGTLEGAARSYPLARPQSYSNTDYLEAMALTLTSLVAHRRR